MRENVDEDDEGKMGRLGAGETRRWPCGSASFHFTGVNSEDKFN